jgi:uncharacterized protein
VAGNDRENMENTGRGVGARLARPGGLSYLEIPAVDAQGSAAFYESVLGWSVEWRGIDDARFADPTGHLIGRWLIGRAPARELGFLAYFYVDGIDRSMERAVGHGGEIVDAPHPEGNLWVARVRDPAGNVIGLWQAGPR